ncbi:alkene reductase [Aspergillus saccharolyticus JOP 1030-1]|uniref:NADH:flavin oxidoreductase NADH oxidase family protein n=1 Tax=Aspergillus saccharolyticus JOP 1030-1 TaxID=1450539 RepID=A0A318Z6R3_9EURO|nr:NADH:flavin oxidoreductase NADH oxidase family protein [Aspergillus saccharolyticus JOP 1030-1]PYH42985.1 NADH:flavin oxidoreductase NADH oxidase family protein [Aspergillus saccharolyticus JOP 1030-1]
MAPTVNPASSRLFEPIQVGRMKLSHRIVFPPLTRNRNDDDHTPLPFMARYYADRASTPGTLVISEATAVSHLEEGQDNTPGFVSDRQIVAWKTIIDAVHEKGSYYFQQVWGMGRASYPELMRRKGLKYRSSSAVPMEGVDAVPEEMTEEDIVETIQSFADTAKRVIAAGGDGVEVHCAHGYLLDQFLSDAVNKRTDKWGGSTENRARLVLEVIKAVVDAVGADRVALRLSPYAAFQQAEKGDIHGQYLYLIAQLKTTVPPLAYLSLVEATGDPGALIFGGKAVNQGKTLDFILEAWDNRSPVIVAGGYHPETAAWAVEKRYNKWNTLVAFGRHFLANPDLVFRIRHKIELNKYNRPTFYLAKNEIGYNDYPFSKEYLAAQQRQFPSSLSCFPEGGG